ncbi:MAG: tRNA uridine-5-carboxymethylaminomethyl(34) synthesis GTPase MnmE [Cyclobacteriaceae bacterium]|jgi:tRNA modification GTPase|nr:tRNA uridine-5-carboxymethylaminomethyl(34) synthesis GTPase MnmE [Cyclobacteriaceae bacterium]
MLNDKDTIVAPATPPGVAALAVIRLSGAQAIEIASTVFRGKNLLDVESHTIHFGSIRENEKVIDEVLISVFKNPHSYTGENSVEISCHGSPVVVKEIIKLLIKQGARLAEPGEFTRRAFLNNKLDLAQAEAVGDLIHSETELSRQVAVNQMRGGYSKNLSHMREELIHFASLIELELDFGEEDVEFAQREDLIRLTNQILTFIQPLIESFDQGNVIKNGVPTVIAGKPNAGKSTLLNALLNDERAIVSDIPGTTRDFIEDEIVLDGISFRFIDTAGLRETTDQVEHMGIQRTKERMEKASLILYLFDLANETKESMITQIESLKSLDARVILVGNKADIAQHETITFAKENHFVLIAAFAKQNLEQLKKEILNTVLNKEIKSGGLIVTNLRHFESLRQTHEALSRVKEGIESGITGDLVAQDIRQALHYLGELTGAITTDDLLGNIFSKFCIGK